MVLLLLLSRFYFLLLQLLLQLLLPDEVALDLADHRHHGRPGDGRLGRRRRDVRVGRLAVGRRRLNGQRDLGRSAAGRRGLGQVWQQLGLLEIDLVDCRAALRLWAARQGPPSEVAAFVSCAAAGSPRKQPSSAKKKTVKLLIRQKPLCKHLVYLNQIALCLGLPLVGNCTIRNSHT